MFSIPYTDENGIHSVASLPSPSSINEYGVGTFRINGIDIELQIADEVISNEEDFDAFVSYKTSRSASETRVAVIAEDIDVDPILISQPDIVLTSLSDATITIKHSGETNTDSISGQALFYISADNVRISRLNIEADDSGNEWDKTIRLLKISDTFGEDGYNKINSTVLSDVSLNSNGKTGPLLDVNNTKVVVLKNVSFSGNSNYYSYVTITKSLDFIFDGITLPALKSINFTYADNSEYFFSSGTFSNVSGIPFITWDSELFISEESFDYVKSQLSGLDAFIDDAITATDLDLGVPGFDSLAYHILYNKNISNEYLETYRPALIQAIKDAINGIITL